MTQLDREVTLGAGRQGASSKTVAPFTRTVFRPSMLPQVVEVLGFPPFWASEICYLQGHEADQLGRVIMWHFVCRRFRDLNRGLSSTAL